MRTRKGRALASLACGLSLVLGGTAAAASEWWMLQQTDKGRECAEPIELRGIHLTPDVLMEHHRQCRLMEETPSLDLEAVMVDCKGDIDRVFIFTRSKAECERLIAD